MKKIPKEIGKKTFKLYDPIFKQRIWVLLNYDQKAYNSFLKREDIIDENSKLDLNNFQGLSFNLQDEKGIKSWVILLKEFYWTIKHQGTLIHEIVHTIIKIWDSNNIPFNMDTQEFLAHSVSNLYEDIALRLIK